MYAIMEHEVKDYGVWKEHFDMNRDERKRDGTTGKEHIYRDVENPNKIMLGMEFKDKEKFESMINSDHTKQVMKEAGVIKVPSVTIYEMGNKGMVCACQTMTNM